MSHVVFIKKAKFRGKCEKEMSFYRGKDWRGDEMSNMDIALLIKFNKAWLNKEIPEVPTTHPWTFIGLGFKREVEIIAHPDFHFLHWRFWKPVFIDGEVHSHDIIAKRDLELNRLMEEQGFTPIRIRYKDDTKAEEQRIFDMIIAEMKIQ